MKINWGWGIGIFYSIFVLTMISIVYATTFYKPDMVSDDYYRDEQVFQKQIDKSINTQKLEVQPSILVQEGSLIVKFPEDMKDIKGILKLFRPSDSKLDQKIELNVNDNNTFNLDLKNIQKGKWLVKINWESAGVSYYIERTIFN
jgi:hypothetical protein